MYSSSRGILYTAPPDPDETDDGRTTDVAATSTADGDTETTASGSADGIAADD